MATDPPPQLVLTPIRGKPRTVRELLTTFHLVFVALDPFTNESAWILPTAARILTVFDQADCRVAWLVAGATPEECRMFLGPWAEQMLTFADPDREAVKAFGLERLPALVHLGIDGTIVGAAEGWKPAEWRAVTDRLAKMMSWRAPAIPSPRDPAPFVGTPAPG
ncbi:MAG: hypothetical protein E6G27_01945 [Actinobacteria bacterium]|nr:MAG: hypothetical protein E6G27_01945 [Actinomycetota bacterium]